VLVPFPHAVDDHQTTNARFLSERGAAVPGAAARELTPQRLADLLRSFSRSVLLEMAQQARSMAKPEATQSVVDECDRLAA
jgi:UDP-N-acetylglucosamine--N-acetylmuramyl-(pentapeptide) pyrophosphoryl-undecaprenol N-acetylglucosamine transferase